MNDKAPGALGHEPTDVQARPLWFTAAGLVVGCLLIAVAVAYMFDVLKYRAGQRDVREETVLSVAKSRSQFPGPRLQVTPDVDLSALRAREDTELTTYGWIDKNAGVVRIPIDRAMDLLIERGLPVNGGPGAPEPHRTALDLQQTRPLERETQSTMKTK